MHEMHVDQFHNGETIHVVADFLREIMNPAVEALLYAVVISVLYRFKAVLSHIQSYTKSTYLDPLYYLYTPRGWDTTFDPSIAIQ